jgi:hypothetical protein
MSGKAVAGLTGIIVALVIGCIAALGLVGGSLAAAVCAAPMTAASPGSTITPDGGWLPVGRWSSDQVTNAATIVTVGQQLHVPPRGWVIAVAIAMQESSLRNLGPNNDRDSLGLFQQRPSQGWGTPAQILDPIYAATQLYNHLLQVPNWQDLRLTVSAQTVQISAHPAAYAKWEHEAYILVNYLGFTHSGATPEDLGQCMSPCFSAISSSSSGPTGGCTGSEAVLERAMTWLTAWNGGPVPYLSSGDPATWFGGYRRDCSGYASMALGLAGPGLTAAQLAARATPIPKEALSAGDLLINPAPDLAGHVVIFDHWTDLTMTSYVGFEQAGDGGTRHRTIPYPYFGNYQMSPYHWLT